MIFQLCTLTGSKQLDKKVPSKAGAGRPSSGKGSRMAGAIRDTGQFDSLKAVAHMCNTVQLQF